MEHTAIISHQSTTLWACSKRVLDNYMAVSRWH